MDNMSSISAEQNLPMGYDETLCLECVNQHGSIAQHDNWRIQQVMDCGIALVGALQPSVLPNIELSYLDTVIHHDVANGYADFFTNPHSVPCGPVTEC